MGRGKRAGKIGSFLLGVYDSNTQMYYSVCKCGTGFTDEQLEQLHNECKQLKLDKKPDEFAEYELLMG